MYLQRIGLFQQLSVHPGSNQLGCFSLHTHSLREERGSVLLLNSALLHIHTCLNCMVIILHNLSLLCACVPPTNTAEIVQRPISRTLIHKVPLREESESVEQFEYGVARLMDGHDYHTIPCFTQSVMNKHMNKLSIAYKHTNSKC